MIKAIKGVAFKGDIKDVCAELKAEAERCKGMTVGQYLQRRELEKAWTEELGEPFKVKKF